MKILLTIISFLYALPYISPFPINADTKPYAFLASVLYLALIPSKKFSKRSLSISFLLLILSVFAAISFFDHLTARLFFSFVSFIPCFLLGSVLTLDLLPRVSKALVTSIYVYFFGSLIQILFGPDSLLFLTHRPFGYAFRGGRGLESFAAEPTYLGIHLVLIITVILFIQRKATTISNQRLTHFVSLIIIIFISRSTTVIVSSLFAGLIVFLTRCYSATRFRFSLRFILLFSLITTTSILFVDLSSVRFYSILTKLLSDPLSIVISDLSVNDRVHSLIIPLTRCITDYCLPNPLSDSWRYYLESNLSSFPYATNVSPGRIHSFIGSYLFYFGFFGVLLLIPLLSPFLRFAKNADYAFAVCLVTCLLLSLQSIQPSNPLFAFTAGLLINNKLNTKITTT